MRGLTYREVVRINKILLAAVVAAAVGFIAVLISDLPESITGVAKTEPKNEIPVEVKKEEPKAETKPVVKEVVAQAKPQKPETPEEIDDLSADSEVRFILTDTSSYKTYQDHYGSMPDDCEKLIHRRREGVNYQFNDTNDLHLAAARPIGIDPVTSPKTAWRLRQPIVRVNSCKYYFIDTLKHSYPYLVPKAEELLREIGRSFRDSLVARGGGDYRIKVTSLMRTPLSIAELRRRNRNSVDSSAHQYATTFDISYAKFICDSPSNPRTIHDLKELLIEILGDLRDKQHCYVKYEKKQQCFHITTR